MVPHVAVCMYMYPKAHTQKLHYEELLLINHPGLFPIIKVSFDNNHIKWEDETLHDETLHDDT